MPSVNLLEWLKSRFYEKSEVDTKVNSKANSNHTHSSIYYDKNDIDIFFSDFMDQVDSKIDSLNSSISSLNTDIILGTNVDFNTLKTVGNYTINWTNMQSATNNPANTGGRLEVKNLTGDYRSQIFIQYGFPDSCHIYFRTYNSESGIWGSWRQII